MKSLMVRCLLLVWMVVTMAGLAEASMAAPGASHTDGKDTTEPVALALGNLFLPRTDVKIPGQGLELTRTFNSQVTGRIPDWKSGVGAWVVENGELSGETGYMLTNDEPSDFDISFKVKTIAQDPEGVSPDLEFYTGWLHFRFQDYNNHYQLLLKTTGILEMVKYVQVNGQVQRTFWRQQTTASPFQWNTLRVRMTGGRIQVFLNDAAVFDVVDSSPLPAGHIGLEAHYSHVHWDDMLLTNPVSGEVCNWTFNDIPNHEGMFGYAWSSSLEMHVATVIDEDYILGKAQVTEKAQVVREDGLEDYFTKQPDGSYKARLGIHDKLTQTPSGYTLRRKDGLTWTFDTLGRLTTVTDRNGNAVTLTRDAQGRVTTATDPTGRQLSFTYGANGKVATMTDPANRQWSYTYDSSNHLIQVADPLGLVEKYIYDLVTHNLTQYTDKSGAVYQYTYNIYDRIKTQTDPEGKTTHFVWEIPYNGLGGTLSVSVINAKGDTWKYRFKLEDEVRPDVHNQIHVITDPYGNTEGFAWDVDKNRIGKTDESDRSVFWEYDAGGNPTKIIQFVPPAGSGLSSVSILQYESTFNQLTALYDPNQHETHYEYDAHGNLTKLWRPFNYVDRVENTQTYNASGQLLTSTDPLGRRWSFAYDANGNRTSATDPMGNATTATYDVIGRPTSITDANGHTTSLTWDADDRLIKITDSAGNDTIYTYDGTGNVLSVTNPEGNKTTFTYDKVGNLTQVTDPLGNSASYTWDTADSMHFGTSRLTSKTDANGKTTKYDYDRRGRLIKVTDPLNNVTQYGYDRSTHVTSITDANGKVTTYTYDDLERLTQVTDPLGNKTTFTYLRQGQVASKTDAEGQTTTYTYDELDRLTKIAYSDGTTVAYAYDKAGNRTSMTDSTGITRYTYDALNRPIQITTPDNQTVTFAYDKINHRTSMTSAIGVTGYTYDALDRLTRLTDPQSGAYDFGYDKTSRRISVRFPNGVQAAYQYDAASRLTQLKYQTSGAAVLAQLDYTYDPAGNILNSLRDPAGASGAGTSSYTYDALSQLTKATYPDGTNETFAYDPVGNRLTAGGIAYAYDAANRLLKAGSVTYAYDNIGNLSTKHDPVSGSMTYAYDGVNRLVAVDPASVVTRSLSPGWNFIASPFLGASVDVRKTLSPLNAGTDYDQLSRYNGSSGAFEHFAGIDRYDQFTTVDPAQGYQLYETNPSGSTVNLPATQPSRQQSVSLPAGWNLVGSPRTQSLPVSDALSPLVQGTDYDQVKQFNPSTNQYEPAATLQPGTSYWLHTMRAANLTLPVPTQHAITYTYNSNGNRVAKTVQGVVTKYLYDGVEVLAEFDQTGTLTTSYVHGLGVDELLATRNHATNQTLYFLRDHLGSPIVLVDASQQVQATFSYAAFGATRSKTGSEDSRFRFTGRELDPESGLYHYRARAYDPAVGRFLQPDPLPRTPADPRMMKVGYFARLAAVNHPLPGAMPGFLPVGLPAAMMSFQARLLQNPLGLNAYAYVLSNPLRFLDPLGSQPKDLGPVEQVPLLEDPVFLGITFLDQGLNFLKLGFSRGGFLNNNPYFRIGLGWKGSATSGIEVFRIAIGNKDALIHLHIDLW